MNVKTLIEQLARFDPQLPVTIYCVEVDCFLELEEPPTLYSQKPRFQSEDQPDNVSFFRKHGDFVCL
jgi:hypothetical protein